MLTLMGSVARTAQSYSTYCLFCESGYEGAVCDALARKGYSALSPLVMRWKKGRGVLKKKATRLLPGYVFFDALQPSASGWWDIGSIRHLLRILEYGPGQRALRGEDLAFVAWLKSCNGTIDVSSVLKVGTKMTFVDGPLKDMEGRIIKVNKNRKVVQVSFGDDTNLMRSVWCPIEYVEANSDASGLQDVVRTASHVGLKTKKIYASDRDVFI